MYCPNNMSSVKCSNMYWSTYMSLLKRSRTYWLINMSSLKSSNMYWSTSMSFRIGSNRHWLHQYATKFNMIYNTYWKSYRIVQDMIFPNNYNIFLRFSTKLVTCENCAFEGALWREVALSSPSSPFCFTRGWLPLCTFLPTTTRFQCRTP